MTPFEISKLLSINYDIVLEFIKSLNKEIILQIKKEDEDPKLKADDGYKLNDV